MSDLPYLCRMVLSNTYCVVFLLCLSSSCLPCVASLYGLFMFDCPFCFLKRLFASFSGSINFWLALRVSLTFMFPVSLDFPCLIAPSVVSNVYFPVSLDCPFWLHLPCSLTFICQFLWIVYFWLALRFYRTVMLPVSLDYSCLIAHSVFSNVYFILFQ